MECGKWYRDIYLLCCRLSGILGAICLDFRIVDRPGRVGDERDWEFKSETAAQNELTLLTSQGSLGSKTIDRPSYVPFAFSHYFKKFTFIFTTERKTRARKD
ncbi:hypothetical protein RRG08_002963 [Elysia crispata]|uniref:Uncharacterized protein n=1 Tax=Elysia crispata TaxID=231223 RepID=A0AAE1E2Z5_9GAST|nr:hypothetical protein RRG08_002963 [Elysia crispata]